MALRHRTSQDLRAAQERQATYANMKRRDYTFRVGDRVLLSSKDINIRDLTPKLRLKYQGPWQVTKVVSPVAYRLDLPPSMKIHPVFHISKLERFHDNYITLHTFNVHGANRSHGTGMTRLRQKRKLEIDMFSMEVKTLGNWKFREWE